MQEQDDVHAEVNFLPAKASQIRSKENEKQLVQLKGELGGLDKVARRKGRRCSPLTRGTSLEVRLAFASCSLADIVSRADIRRTRVGVLIWGAMGSAGRGPARARCS